MLLSSEKKDVTHQLMRWFEPYWQSSNDDIEQNGDCHHKDEVAGVQEMEIDHRTIGLQSQKQSPNTFVKIKTVYMSWLTTHENQNYAQTHVQKFQYICIYACCCITMSRIENSQ